MIRILVPRRVVSQHQHRPGSPVPDESNPRPDVDCPGQPVAALGNKHDPLSARLLHPVDGLLQRLAVVAGAVAMNGKPLPGQVDSFRIVQTDGVVRRPAQRHRRHSGGNPRQHLLSHDCQHRVNRFQSVPPPLSCGPRVTRWGAHFRLTGDFFTQIPVRKVDCKRERPYIAFRQSAVEECRGYNNVFTKG